MHPQYGWTTSAVRDKNGLKLLRTSDISGGCVDWSTVPACKKPPKDPEKYLLLRGDLVVSRAGSVGLSYLVQECPRAVFASYLIRFRARRPISSHFVSLFMNSPAYWSAIAQQSAGIALPNVNASKLRKIEIPFPPLAEQKRIVAKVEELLARVNAARERLAKVPAILKRFRQSVLAAACSGRLTEDWREAGTTDWASCPLEDLIADGPQNGLYKPKNAYGEGTLIVRIDNFYDGVIQPWHCLDRLRVSEKERASYGLREGDILINRVNSMTFLGKSALAQGLQEPCVFESNMMRFSVDTRRILAHYLIRYLNSPNGLAELRKNAKHAVNQSSINQRDVAAALVPLAPLPEQQEIVRRVEGLFSLADSIEERVKAATARAEKLTQSILAKAFRGELVPTEAELARRDGRTYETAAQLLARIQAWRERAADRKPSPSRTRRRIGKKPRG